MEVLKTDRLLLRTWTENDLDSGFSIWGDEEVMKFIDDGKPKTLEQVKSSIYAGIQHQQKYGYQHWAVTEIDSRKLIGACGFNRTEQDGEIELVFHFAKAHWNKGYAKEAAQGCIQHAIQVLRPKKIIASCHPKNEISKRVLLKVGFTFISNLWYEDTQREELYFEMPTHPNS